MIDDCLYYLFQLIICIFVNLEVGDHGVAVRSRLLPLLRQRITFLIFTVGNNQLIEPFAQIPQVVTCNDFNFRDLNLYFSHSLLVASTILSRLALQTHCYRKGCILRFGLDTIGEASLTETENRLQHVNTKPVAPT